MESLTVETILVVYSAAEIDAKIAALKEEQENYYTSATADGKSGMRSIEKITSDLNAFATAKGIKGGVPLGGVVSAQATWGGN